MTDRFQESKAAHPGRVGRELRHLEADHHVTLGAKVVDLVGANLVERVDQRGGVAQVGVVQEERDIMLVGIPIEMVDPAGIE